MAGDASRGMPKMATAPTIYTTNPRATQRYRVDRPGRWWSRRRLSVRLTTAKVAAAVRARIIHIGAVSLTVPARETVTDRGGG